MQTGRFSRGPHEFSAQASIVLGGNIETDVKHREPAQHYLHLFVPLPPELHSDAAFLDRLHAFLPGWELPKIRPSNYATGLGFITDYLAEIFNRLRRLNYQTIVSARVRFEEMTGRNQDAIKRTTSGLLKLLYPHKDIDSLRPEELKPCLELAVECRQRIIDQLARIAPTEFAGLNLDSQITVTE